MRKARKVTIVEQRQIIELYEAGWSSGQIAKMINRPPSTVLSLLRRNKIPRRGRNSYRDSYNRLDYDRLKLAHHLYEQGYLLYEIGRQMGVSASTAGRYLQRFGAPLRSRGETMTLIYDRGLRARNAHQPQAAHTRMRRQALTTKS